MPRPDFSALLNALRKFFAPRLLLLIWNVDGLKAVVAEREGGGKWRFSEPAGSRISDFAAALDEALAGLRVAGIARIPRVCLLASRFVVPARLDLPIDPDSPRPEAQMRELACAEMEPVLAEAGALWSIGAVLAARGSLTPEQRERVALELAIRREQASDSMFGQTACALSFIEQFELEESLAWQEKLQILEASLACGWKGFASAESGNSEPVWLAAAIGLSAWGRWESVCARHGLKLLGALPFAWSVSETPEETETRVALEIHSEDVVAVLRHRGRIVAARSEGRMERPLEAGWLMRMIEDWRTGGACALEIVCLNDNDETAALTLADALAERWGRAPIVRNPATAWRDLLSFLAQRGRNAGRDTQKMPLPMIRYGRPKKPLWKKAGLWQALIPLLIVACLAGVETRQRAQIKAVQTRLDLSSFEDQKKTQEAQQLTQFYQQQKQANQTLTARRQEVTRLIPELERLQSIEHMTTQLPRLLRALAASIGDDAALDVVRNSSDNEMGRVQVLAWSPNYNSAQTFALNTQAASGALGYAVAQANVKAAKGRNGQDGYQVSFWMLPVTEELGIEDTASTKGGV
ncbi:MAG: hypothetical protein LBQ81_09545 [Zoogloeaceae bacterium]|jgi:hypothetical protein|nr:hypothetical protein [Zoogloeaceae bacterium]